MAISQKPTSGPCQQPVYLGTSIQPQRVDLSVPIFRKSSLESDLFLFLIISFCATARSQTLPKGG
jgi:hypothetical protein